MTNDNDKKRAFPMPKAEQNFTRWTNNNVTRLPADMAGALALIDSLVVQRDAAEALARERENEVATANGFSFHVCSERDAAQQMVAEMRWAAQSLVNDLDESDDVAACDFGSSRVPLEKALALSAPIAGRWCLASERDEAVRIADLAGTRYIEAVAKQAAAIARAEKAEATLAERDDDFAGARRMRDDAERRESELGLQVVAQAARLRLADGLRQTLVLCRRAMAGCYVVGSPQDSAHVAIDVALAAWDAVPGDVGGQS